MFQYSELESFANIFPAVLVVCAMLATVLFALGSNPNMEFEQVAIYARYSSDKQRDTSIDDQIRNVRIHLDKLGIPHNNAIILYDKEISGEREDREGYQKLRNMIRCGEVSLVACDEVSRFDRGSEMGVAAEEMELYGCRFVTADGYDSEHDSHGLMATIKGKMAGMANRELAHRIRRGLAGRASDPKGANGSHPFGYSTRYVDPVAAQNYCGTGPKPFKEVFINDAEAAIVREIFEMYVSGVSLTDIARDLNERGVPPGSRSKRYDKDGNIYHNGWHKVRVAKILRQKKYVGEWDWGKNKYRKDRQGKRIVRPADPRDIIKSSRPELAIVPLELWDRAQEIRKRNCEKFGFKEGQQKRGPRSHYSEEYPSDLTGGLLFCGKCGARLHLIPENKGQGPYYHCPIAVIHGKRHGVTDCNQRGHVHRGRAIEALTAHLKEFLLRNDEWLKDVHDSATSKFLSLKADTPDKVTALESRLREIDSATANIAKAIETTFNASSGVLVKRLGELEAEKAEIERKHRQLAAQSRDSFELPPIEWIQSELIDFVDVLMDDQANAAKLFRQYFGKVKVHIVVAPGKKRGHAVLEFTPNRHRLFASVAGFPEQEPWDSESKNPEEVVTLTLAGSDRLDKLMPTIDAMRRNGVSWKEISKTLKISKSWSNRYYNTWKRLTQESQGGQAALSTSAPGDAG